MASRYRELEKIIKDLSAKKEGRKEEKSGREERLHSRSPWRLACARHPPYAPYRSKEYPLLRPVMARLHGKGPMKDTRRRSVQARTRASFWRGREFMLAAAARGSRSKTRRIFSIDHSNPRTCESADFAYGRPSGPYTIVGRLLCDFEVGLSPKNTHTAAQSKSVFKAKPSPVPEAGCSWAPRHPHPHGPPSEGNRE